MIAFGSQRLRLSDQTLAALVKEYAGAEKLESLTIEGPDGEGLRLIARAVSMFPGLLTELQRVRTGAWIDAAAEEIVGEGRGGSTSPSVIASLIRRHLAQE